MPFRKSNLGPGWGGPRNGLGWGGPPQGEGAHNERKPFRRGQRVNPAGPNCQRSERSLKRQERSAALEDMLYHLMHNAESEMMQLIAATKLHEI
jgi:hypothetical protein